MKLSNLINEEKDIEIIQFYDTDIKGIAEDSRHIKPGYLFFAVKGFQRDGHDFIEDAIKKGAVAVIGSDAERLKKFKNRKISLIKTRNIRKTLGNIAHTFHGKPSEKLKLIGITGTNGKTTTSFIIYQALKNLGKKVGLIGSVYYITPLSCEKADRTTPPPIKLNQLLKRMVNEGAEYAVMEVSSHSISLHRIEGIKFNAGIFTNLSPEHLDFHKNIHSYFLAKYKFTDFIKKEGIFATNSDDFFGRIIAGLKAIHQFKMVSYGYSGDIKIEKYIHKNGFSEIELSLPFKNLKLKTNLKGKFNVYNIAAAVSILNYLDIDIERMKHVFKDISVPGRLEEIAPGIFIDYAHTPDALEKVLKTLKELYPQKHLTVVFGCGGNRDKSKRPVMGAIACKYADRVIITDDNPRFENPDKIVEEILSGCNMEKAEVIRDREKAIKTAIKHRKGIVIIAGKGPDEYQEINGVKQFFSDKKTVLEALNDNNKTVG
ncbi:UDP-N-acetylmuramoyl-L-alanyl-D-glutamate--2,6-diaminopimelate ligase [Desulfurobacterium atlanticum]|uniref:UDP-N-acetylmuramoyl-L-alanyl-D-glutamate--2,6-diaminopimelate ligase n=1 Tax=Desulfurobacterium atlanticum TaxID=240169 RepID=A0A238YFM1_9BACT|nr:UDP-N-acetylmuramoyl-L-alanyl-D-glutamate--2,6-diaminopimelate ligase [Desulfurobacterium atlanticum]SNR69772.1 UDP-N-acetylmuramoylalanyl-D-glutamate--2,6-diaminopimelate ligase [Desulfurobacterium atlanticum]